MIDIANSLTIRALPTTRAQRVSLVAAACAWLIAAVGAFVVPLDAPSVGLSDDVSAITASDAAAVSAENLESFLASTRWGGASLAELRRQAEGSGDSVRRDTDEIAYLGFAERRDRATVLLRLPDGSVDERRIGELLPDGRRLAALGDTRLTLDSPEDQASSEDLLLFPEVTSDEPEPPNEDVPQ